MRPQLIWRGAIGRLEIRVSRAHKTTKGGAKSRVDSLLPQLFDQFGDGVSNVHHTWTDSTMRFSVRVRGFDLKGTLDVTDGAVTLDVGIPLLLRPLQGRIEAVIQDKLAEYFP